MAFVAHLDVETWVLALLGHQWETSAEIALVYRAILEQHRDLVERRVSLAEIASVTVLELRTFASVLVLEVKTLVEIALMTQMTQVVALEVTR